MPFRRKIQNVPPIAGQITAESLTPKDRLCTTCGVIKPLTDFNTRGLMANGEPKYMNCRRCQVSESRRLNIRNRFSLTEDDYDTILNHQGGVCAICKRAPRKTRLAIDHCHATGLVRGLLCARCNQNLAFVEEQIDRALSYLHAPPAIDALGREIHGKVGGRQRRHSLGRGQAEPAAGEGESEEDE